MKIIILLFSVLLIGGCSVSEESFLNQIKGKTIYPDLRYIEPRGQFSTDGRTFNFTGGTVEYRIERAINDNEAEYIQLFVGQQVRAFFKVDGDRLNIRVEDGSPAQDFYLGTPAPPLSF